MLTKLKSTYADGLIKVIGDDGFMNEDAGDYQGLSREDARVKIVEDLKESGNLVKIEDYSHNVGHCERCKTVIEPLISSQWFVKMEELARPAIEVVENGKVKFMDEQYKKTYLNWMKNIKDWCISRQIWSGHDIPIFTCNDCGEVIVEETDPTSCPKCHGKNLTQELDKLDTWFSSALWPISTLGYPNDTEELKYFYPTNVMVTAREIINLWVARMIFSGLEYVGEIPFEDIVINGIVKDAQGRKMSKTLGNGTDPIEMIDKYGVDSLRFSVFDGVAIQSDSRFSEKKVELTRNFMGKIWNAARYVLMQIEGVEIKDISEVKFYIGGKVPCLECEAEEIDNSEQMLCYSCKEDYCEVDDSEVCEICGRTLYYDRDNISYVHGLAVCEHCYETETAVCDICGQRDFIENVKYDKETDRFICRFCREE